MYRIKKQYFSNKFYRTMFAFTAIILAVSGIGYRIIAFSLNEATSAPVVLPVPLNEFPMNMSVWKGKDVPIPESVQRVADNDDFLSRLYISTNTNQWASLYVAYSARPRTMLGHMPEVCYPAAGWIHDNTDKIELVSNYGTKIPCLLHSFHKPWPEVEEVFVLNYYILNGKITRSEKGFSGLGWRTPNISGDMARYVTQVQISSVLENSVITLAEQMTDEILTFFPSETKEIIDSK